MFKKNVHNFRGISIVFIVFSHCYFSIFNFGNNENFFAKMFENMISGGSAFFVFISGFLFLSIYKSNERYFDFLLKKIRFVYLPFLFFISFDLFYIILMNVLNFISPSDRYHFYREALFNFDFLSVYIVGKSFVTSGILWYVPFIMFIYLLSPIFLSYSKLKVNIRVYIFLLSMLVSLLLFRTHKFEVFSVVHNVVYFLPFYLLGILSSQSENTLQLKINNLTIIFLIILSLTMSYISVLNPLGILKSLDLMLIQKLSFCIVFISVLKNINSNIINVLAKNSYGIFFIHTIILYLGGRILSLFNLNYKTESFIIFLMISNLVLFISLQVVVLVKRILGSKSKFIIGV